MSQHNTVSFAGKRVSPSKVVCVGRNYLAHIEELGNAIPTEPVIFIKPNSAIGESLCTQGKDDIHFEAELCLLIQNGIIAGLGFGLDLTKRCVQSKLKEKGLPWERAKAFDNAVVFSEFVECPAALSSLSISLSIDKKIRQQGAYSQMIYKPDALVANIQEFMTLADYDIVMTGTPSGVGKVEKGQVFTGEVFNDSVCIVASQWIAS
jgi:2-keto-4-pentenoate hydratase/2-oxohepta-3-ene-1,7-dioic acid hydratase in catechol pathway